MNKSNLRKSSKNLNEIREKKKLAKLDKYSQLEYKLQKIEGTERSKSFSFDKNLKFKEKSYIQILRGEMNSRFDQIDTKLGEMNSNIDEMKGSLNNLFYMFVLKEGISISKDQKKFLNMSIKNQIDKNFSQYVTNYQNFNDSKKIDNKRNEFKARKEKKIISKISQKKIISNNIFDIKREKMNLLKSKYSKDPSVKKRFSFTKKPKEKFISKENISLTNTEINKSQNESLQFKSDSKTIISKENKRIQLNSNVSSRNKRSFNENITINNRLKNAQKKYDSLNIFKIYNTLNINIKIIHKNYYYNISQKKIQNKQTKKKSNNPFNVTPSDESNSEKRK